MKYASSDITVFINANCPTGGHQRKIANQKDVNKGAEPIFEQDELVGNHLVVNCPVCEPLLIAKDSWSSDPDEIPLTGPEKAQAKKREAQALEHGASMAEAFARVAEREMAASRPN